LLKISVSGVPDRFEENGHGGSLKKKRVAGTFISKRSLGKTDRPTIK
jgi:hypothetical protein